MRVVMLGAGYVGLVSRTCFAILTELIDLLLSTMADHVGAATATRHHFTS